MKKMIVLLALCFALPSMAMEKKYSEKQEKANQQLIKVIREAIKYDNIERAAEVEGRIVKNPKLLQDALDDSLKKAQEALNDGADIEVNFRDHLYPGISTLLHFAAFYNTTKVMDFLINAGANVNAVSPDKGESAVHLCFPPHRGGFNPGNQHSRPIDCLKLLIKAGANVNAQTSNNETPLHYAAQKVFGHIKGYSLNEALIKLLIDSGADIHVQDDKGKLFVARVPAEFWSEYKDLITILRLISVHQKTKFSKFSPVMWGYVSFFLDHMIKHKDFIALQNFNFALALYNKFGKEDWIKKAEFYPWLQFVYFIQQGEISEDIAKQFIKNLNYKEFSSNIKLGTIQRAYSFAKKYDLKKMGKFILQVMETLAKTPHDVGGIVASFMQKD